MIRSLILLSLFLPYLSAHATTDYRQIAYLISIHQEEKALETYLQIYEEKKHHDFDILAQLATTIIEKGATSTNVEDQLLSLYGMGLSENTVSMPIFYSFIHSHHPLVQAASLHLIGKMFDDEAEKLLLTALTSSYVMIRMEALFYLAQRHVNVTFGQIQSLQNLIPPPFHPYFAEFYAIDASDSSRTELKKMISHPSKEMRLSAILSILKYRIEDLKEAILPILSQTDPMDLEAAAFTSGALADLSAIKDLERLTDSNYPEVQLSSLYALTKLGYTDYLTKIEKLAQNHSPFAITILGELNTGKETLKMLLSQEDITLRLNALLSLLKERNPIVMPYLLDLFDMNLDLLGFAPVISPGKTMLYWQIIPLRTLPDDRLRNNCRMLTQYFLEEILSQAVELGEDSFLQLASSLFAKRQDWLIPKLIVLLENVRSEDAIAMLKEKSQQIGAPLLRSYANLALFRMGENIESQEALIRLLLEEKQTELIQFRPMMEEQLSVNSQHSPYQLTPEETSGFLIEALVALSHKRHEINTTYLLRLMKDGHPRNRYALAGLLLRSIS